MTDNMLLAKALKVLDKLEFYSDGSVRFTPCEKEVEEVCDLIKKRLTENQNTV